MNKLYWIAIALAPFLLAEIYFAILQYRSRKAIQKFKSADSKLYPDLKILFEHYDASNRKHKLSTSRTDTLYTFKDVDLITGSKSFLLVGKLRFMGFARKLYPTVFVADSNQSEKFSKNRIAVVKNVRSTGEGLEIDFEDPRYTNVMTLVITKPNQALKEFLTEVFGA